MIKNALTKIATLQDNNEFSRYLSNTLWLFGDKVVRLGLNFIIVVLLSRYLGPDHYGLLSYSQSLVGIFVAFSTLGLEVVLVRELSVRKGRTQALLGSALVLKLVASLISLLLLLIYGLTLSHSDSTPLTNILALVLIFQSVSLGLDSYFQANVLSRLTSLVNILVGVISALLKLYLIYVEAELIVFAYVIVVESSLVLAGYVYFYVQHSREGLRLKYDHKIATELLSSAWPLLLVSLSVFLYTRLDMIMLKNLMNNASAGHYSAAARVAEIFYFIPALIVQSIFPKVVEMKGRTEEEYFGFLQKIYTLLVWGAVPIAVLVSSFSIYIISLLYGSEYSPSASVLTVLSLAIVLNAVGTLSTKILYIERYEKKYLFRSIIGLIVNIWLNFILIPVYGPQGAAWATVGTLFAIFYLYDIFDRDLAKFFLLKVRCFYTFSLRSKRIE